MKKIVLAYSGGLDTSVILVWLKEKTGAPIVAYVGDVGQPEDLVAVAAKARKTGASEVVVQDLRDEFAREFVFPAVAANAVYEAGYLLGTSLARPSIARGMIQTALGTGADAVSHGATGKGNDQLRFELAVHALAPRLKIIAPWREWEFTGRAELLAYATKHGIPVPVTADKPYSMDANLMHVSYEGGILEDPAAEAPEEMFRTTVAPEKAPEKAEPVAIRFESGFPVEVDGKPFGPATLVAHLNERAGRHGVGRLDLVESRAMGLKSRGVYETPGVTLLHLAARAVESLTLDREVLHIRDTLAPKFARLVYDGLWFSPEMKVLLATLEAIRKPVTGTAKLKLYKGCARVVGRTAPKSLYSTKAVSFDTAGVWTAQDATGHIKVLGYRLAAHGGLQ